MVGVDVDMELPLEPWAVAFVVWGGGGTLMTWPFTCRTCRSRWNAQIYHSIDMYYCVHLHSCPCFSQWSCAFLCLLSFLSSCRIDHACLCLLTSICPCPCPEVAEFPKRSWTWVGWTSWTRSNAKPGINSWRVPVCSHRLQTQDSITSEYMVLSPRPSWTCCRIWFGRQRTKTERATPEELSVHKPSDIQRWACQDLATPSNSRGSQAK